MYGTRSLEMCNLNNRLYYTREYLNNSVFLESIKLCFSAFFARKDQTLSKEIAPPSLSPVHVQKTVITHDVIIAFFESSE